MLTDIADDQRIERENKRQTFSSKGARTARRLEQMHLNALFEKAEGLLYGPGIVDQQISNQKLIFYPIENFEVRFLQFLFSRFF